MVAYSFKAQFAEPIVVGVKGGTIRAERKWRYGASRHAEVGGHAFPGEELQLYTGMRTKRCRLIARKTCLSVETIHLDFPVSRIAIGGRLWLSENDELDAFAQFDGFRDFGEMSNFWNQPYFDGWHICWAPMPFADG